MTDKTVPDLDFDVEPSVLPPVSDAALDRLFRHARTRNGWLKTPVPETLIRAVYDLARLGPTSANCSPARFMFLHSAAAKARLEPLLSEGNRKKTLSAPWVVIIANDLNFAEKIPALFPHNPGANDWFANPDVAAETAMRNATLQGGYLIMAARALGLECGPMSGFDKAGVDQAFFADDPAKAGWRSNFLVNLGYGDKTELYARSPRLAFEEACEIL
jgi:3-hydroxypropanoate dehydrogenase